MPCCHSAQIRSQNLLNSPGNRSGRGIERKVWNTLSDVTELVILLLKQTNGIEEKEWIVLAHDTVTSI